MLNSMKEFQSVMGTAYAIQSVRTVAFKNADKWQLVKAHEREDCVEVATVRYGPSYLPAYQPAQHQTTTTFQK